MTPEEVAAFVSDRRKRCTLNFNELVIANGIDAIATKHHLCAAILGRIAAFELLVKCRFQGTASVLKAVVADRIAQPAPARDACLLWLNSEITNRRQRRQLEPLFAKRFFAPREPIDDRDHTFHL